MFYKIPMNIETITTLNDNGFKELDSCVYSENESMPFILLIDKHKKEFWITDEKGVKDAEELVYYKFKKEILPTTLEKINQWNQRTQQ